MSVYILQNCLFFGNITWDEYGNILPTGNSGKIYLKTNLDGSVSLVHSYLDENMEEHECDIIDPPVLTYQNVFKTTG